MKKVLVLIFALLALSCHKASHQNASLTKAESDAPAFDLNDVSILVPLPQTAEELTQSLHINASGAQGELLPQEFFDLIDVHVNELPAGITLESAMTIVAMRIDPCFPSLSVAPANCRRQLRLVLQPVVGNKTLDVAIHLFYDLTPEAFQAFLQDILDMKKTSPASTAAIPLEVHPGLAASSVDSTYAAAFRQMILKYAGRNTLTRLATISLAGVQDFWLFEAFNIVNGQMVEDVIPRVGGIIQSFQLAFPTPGNPSHHMDPAPSSGDSVVSLLSKASVTSMSPLEVTTTIGSSLRIENPDFHSAETVDCVSCHVSMRARHFAEQATNADSTSDINRYRSVYNLANTGKLLDQPNVMRAFGYFGDKPVINDRTINESAEVASYLSRLP